MWLGSFDRNWCDISSGNQEIAKMAEQKLLRRVDLSRVAAISTLNSPKIVSSTWIRDGSTWTRGLAVTGRVKAVRG